jgi:hypothetical protein
MLWPTVSRPVCLGIKPHLGPRPDFYYSWTVATLLRENGSTIPAQLLSGSSPMGPMTTFYSQIQDSPNLEGHIPVFISPRNRVAQLYPQARLSLLTSEFWFSADIPECEKKLTQQKYIFIVQWMKLNTVAKWRDCFLMWTNLECCTLN